LHHGLGDVVCTFEGEATVYRKVIDDTGNQGGKITGPIGEMKEFLENSEDKYLNDSCTDGKNYELTDLDKIFLFAQRHCLFVFH